MFRERHCEWVRAKCNWSALNHAPKCPHRKKKFKKALLEGMKLRPSLGPKQFVGKNGKLTGLEVTKCVSVFDENRRFNPKFAKEPNLSFPAIR